MITKAMRQRMHEIHVWKLKHQVSLSLFKTFLLGLAMAALVILGFWCALNRHMDALAAADMYSAKELAYESRIYELESVLNGKAVMHEPGEQYGKIAEVKWTLIEEVKE